MGGERLLARWRWFVGFFDAEGPQARNTVVEAGRLFITRLSGGERHWWGHHAAFRYDLVGRLTQVRAPLLVLSAASVDDGGVTVVEDVLS